MKRSTAWWAALTALTVAGGPALAQEKPREPAAAGAEGFVIQSESGDYRLRITGLAQADGRFLVVDDDKAGIDTFVLRRVRPIILATLAERFDVYLVPDFGNGQTVIQDAYLDARFTTGFRVRAGKFKSPFGLERLQSGGNLLFLERALPTSVAPNRDVGLQVHGELGNGVFAYRAAVLNGVPDGGSVDVDTNDGKDVVLRAFLLPFKNRGDAAQLGLGFAASFGNQQGPAPSYRTYATQPFFSYATGVTASGSRTRISPQGYLYAGPVGLLAEYVRSSQDLVKGTDGFRASTQAWQLAGSVFLTGEKAAWTAVAPKTPFDPGKGRWGALELAARVHALQVDEGVFTAGFADASKSAHKATAWAVGLNWHVNRHVKYTLDFEQVRFQGGAKSGDRANENVALVRAQVAY
jgi:phosphate-selective porin OprO/OprP